MAALSYFAESPRQENPYAAPQTRELVLPVALERAELVATPTAEIMPDSTRRWLKAALIVYLVAFVVPFFKATDDWMPFSGVLLFVMGAMMCWHPLMFAWWANIFLLLSRRNLHRGRSQRACVYAGIGVLAAASFIVVAGLGGPGDHFFFRLCLNPPYLCWLAAMILQWIAAVDMRQYNRNRIGESLDRELS